MMRGEEVLAVLPRTRMVIMGTEVSGNFFVPIISISYGSLKIEG